MKCSYCEKEHNPNKTKCRVIDLRQNVLRIKWLLKDSLIREKA